MSGCLRCQYYFNGLSSQKTYWRHGYCWICSTMVSLLPSVLEGLQCRTVFLYLVRPRPGKFVFHYTRARSQQIYSSVPFSILSSFIKLTKVLIVNYGIMIKSIMCTGLHVDKYKITFKLVISSIEYLAARYNWCQGPVPDRSPAVEKHWSRRMVSSKWKKLTGNTFKTVTLCFYQRRMREGRFWTPSRAVNSTAFSVLGHMKKRSVGKAIP